MGKAGSNFFGVLRDGVLRIRTQGIGQIRKGTAKNEERNHKVRRNGSGI